MKSCFQNNQASCRSGNTSVLPVSEKYLTVVAYQKIERSLTNELF
jgi:hypothetical protein